MKVGEGAYHTGFFRLIAVSPDSPNASVLGTGIFSGNRFRLLAYPQNWSTPKSTVERISNLLSSRKNMLRSPQNLIKEKIWFYVGRLYAKPPNGLSSIVTQLAAAALYASVDARWQFLKLICMTFELENIQQLFARKYQFDGNQNFKSVILPRNLLKHILLVSTRIWDLSVTFNLLKVAPLKPL
uniref:Uncharacterized protein n=1 Tax=Glossina palpalis gambiensis TaxID=67801 RepID=A0A1B0BPM7_9MUSC